MDPFHCTLYLEAGRPRITYRGRSVERLDVVIPRLSSATAKYGLEVVAHFEMLGVPCVNGAEAIRTARHKWQSLRRLAERGLPIPRTFAAGDTEFLERSVRRIGGYPFLIKPFEGTQGTGILLFETPLTARSALDTLWSLRQDYLAQEFHPEAAGRDLRVLVVGGRAIGAMERMASEGEFRANYHRGGFVRSARLGDELASIAVTAAETLELGVAGVDLIRTRRGLLLLEANPSPGFEGFEQTTQTDVADAIVRYAVSLADSNRDG